VGVCTGWGAIVCVCAVILFHPLCLQAALCLQGDLFYTSCISVTLPVKITDIVKKISSHF